MVDGAIPLKKVMRQVWAQALPDLPFQPDATWDEIGLDSLKAFEVVLRLEQAVGARLPLELFSLDTTPRQVIKAMTRQAADCAPAQGVLTFLVPGLFGATPILEKLKQGLKGHVAFEYLRVGSIGMPAQVSGDVGRLADFLVRHIKSVQPEGDVRIVGYSTGGMVACEAAARLEAAGRRVAGLCVIDTPMPGVVGNLMPTLLDVLLPSLSSRMDRARAVAAIGALAGHSPDDQPLPFNRDSLLFSICMKLGLLEPARRLVIAALERRDATWSRTARRQVLVRLSFRAALKWRPPNFRGPMLLIAADQLRSLGQVDRWRERYPQIEVAEVRAAHTKLFDPGKLEQFRPQLLRLLASGSSEAAGQG